MDRGNPGFLLNTQPIISILDYGGNTLQASFGTGVLGVGFRVWESRFGGWELGFEF